MYTLLLLLKTHGFKWCVHSKYTEIVGSDVVLPENIESIYCDEYDDHMTVRQLLGSTYVATNVKILRVEIPPPNLLTSHWILVHVDKPDRQTDTANLSEIVPESPEKATL